MAGRVLPLSRRLVCLWLAETAVVAVLCAGCAGLEPDSQASDGVTERSRDPAAGTGSESSGGAGIATDKPDVGGDDDITMDGAAGGGSGDGEPDWFTPYAERVSPLSEFIGTLRAEVFPESVRFDQDPMAVIEEETFECMTAQGFRYAIVDWAAIDAEIDAAMPSLAEEDYMTTQGYGLADSLDEPLVIESSYVDPNEAIKAGLPAAELDAWQQQYDECVHDAQDLYFQPSIIYDALADDMNTLRGRIDSDPRVVDANALWSACMAEQGHGYASPQEIFEHLESTAAPLRDRVRALGGPDYIDASLRADLDALRATEVEIAVADLACSKRLDQVVYEVTVEHEQRFLEENEDRLALLRDELPTMTLGGNVHLWVE